MRRCLPNVKSECPLNKTSTQPSTGICRYTSTLAGSHVSVPHASFVRKPHVATLPSPSCTVHRGPPAHSPSCTATHTSTLTPLRRWYLCKQPGTPACMMPENNQTSPAQDNASALGSKPRLEDNFCISQEKLFFPPLVLEVRPGSGKKSDHRTAVSSRKNVSR